MRAARYDHHGPAHEVIQVDETKRPDPGPGQVRVRVELSGVNPTDHKSRSGATARPIDGFQIPHHDGAGTVDAVGDGVDSGRVGQRVWLWMAAAGQRWGTAAEWTVVPEAQAVPLPDGISPELGASLGVPALTAHRCLFAGAGASLTGSAPGGASSPSRAGSLAGRTVLVTGGAGAVGHFAIELAKHAGARVVTTVSSPEKAELASRAGADLVVDYTADDALDQIRSWSPLVNRVVEVNVGANLGLDLALSGPETVVACYAASGPDPTLPVRACMNAGLSLRFVLLYQVPRADLELGAAEVNSALAAGALSELPVHRFALEETAAAHDQVEAGAIGKVVVDLR